MVIYEDKQASESLDGKWQPPFMETRNFSVIIRVLKLRD